MTILPDQRVRHLSYGLGTVQRVLPEVVLVEFDSGEMLRVRLDTLVLVAEAHERIADLHPDPPLPTLLRATALCIRSINDAWGVFTPSKIQLLPHQLWVCRKVLGTWPTRWLIADDVGLGKTVEAGLILDALLGARRIQRLLILAPASLVEQWQDRMLKMFDIRLTRYNKEEDTNKGDFWGRHRQVVVSMQTLRKNTNNRWNRLLESEPWDLILVDEAHHLNTEEDNRTLAYRLLLQLEEHRRIRSMIFFTGTPHCGKPYAFFGLLHLLRPDLFDPRSPTEFQLRHLREVMIRNNKQQVCDMDGNRIFTPVHVDSYNYVYSPEEQEFYERLSIFIVQGRAFASTLSASGKRLEILVLLSMQKLASSSVAAVSRALQTRLRRLRAAVPPPREIWEEIDEDGPESWDLRSQKEEEWAGQCGGINIDEIPALEELLQLAGQIEQETKVEQILDLLSNKFSGESVLLFTEYKATQALVIEGLERRFGRGCVTFINGDNKIEIKENGGTQIRRISREAASALFNEGQVRFLVSTEAAGEGIDLQKSCATLGHVDLPWNPMRLHQRVGRVSRFGQKRPVQVFLFLNPTTVEGRIWGKLFEKLKYITEAFQNSMEDPEDMQQAVLGMASPGFLEGLLTSSDGEDRLDQWFHVNEGTFGGAGAVDYVANIFGNVSRFEFGSNNKVIPKVDLQDLIPFFRSSLVYEKRKPELNGLQLIFKTPEEWLKEEFLKPQAALCFNRNPPENMMIAGVGGNKWVDLALRRALGRVESLCVLNDRRESIAIITIEEQLGKTSGPQRQVFGVDLSGADFSSANWRLLVDWELLMVLNRLLENPYTLLREREDSPLSLPSDLVARIESWQEERMSGLLKQFQVPKIKLACLIIGKSNDEAY